MKDLNINLSELKIIEDVSKEWLASNEVVLGTAPLDKAHELLTNRSQNIIVDRTFSKTNDLLVNINPVIEELELIASPFQAQSISIVMDELITNAVNHSGPCADKIRLICQRSVDNAIIITIVDQGGILPEEQIKKLFIERTNLMSPRNEPGQKGAGLGLFFCREFSSGIFIHLIEGSSTSVTCLIPYRPSKKSTLVLACIVRNPNMPTF